MTSPSWGFQALIDAMNGIVYIVDLEGNVLRHDEATWRAEAKKGAAPELLEDAADQGLNLFAATNDEPTRNTYRAYHEILASGRVPVISFPYRCDAPDLERQLHMSISALRGPDGTVNAFLYQSILLSQRQRARVAFLGADQRQRAQDEIELPHLACCSYCMDVRFPAGGKAAEGRWLKASDYYREGGTDDVALSHTICPTCQTELIEPMLAELREKAGLARSPAPTPN